LEKHKKELGNIQWHSARSASVALKKREDLGKRHVQAQKYATALKRRISIMKHAMTKSTPEKPQKRG
jgi:hypothetical protein